MKALSYISIPILLLFSSCASTLYTGSDYDDLYYSSSDAPVASERVVANNPVGEQELRANDYYDNIYAGDTLVADNYSVPSDYDAQIAANNSVSGGSGFDYYDDSYANRLNMFYGNYFNPYWQDPFYFNFGYGYGSPYFGFGYNYGYPYFGIGFGFSFGYPYYGYNPYRWDPFYYGGYWGYPYYCYGYGYGYPYYSYYSEGYSTSYGRRERPSTMSSRYNDNLGMAGSRRSVNGTYSGYAEGARRSASGSQSLTPEARSSSAGAAVARSSQDVVRSGGGTSRSAASTQKSQIATKPEYKNANRTYTPSYNNPRMSTRPSYNNSRISDGPGSRVNESRNLNSTAPVRSSQNRVINQGSSERSGSFNNMQRRYSTPSSSTKIYSAPSRRSYNSGRSYSSGSSRSSSYSGGSSSSFSRSSYSGGSSSGSSGGSRSSSSSHSSGGRR